MDKNVFEVGLPIAIETFFKSYLTTHLIGWEPDICLITGVVQSTGQSGKLKVNDHCRMRFLKDGIAYGFETKILAVSYNPLPLMFSRYPKDIQKFAVRKFDRIKVNLPACLSVMGGKEIMDATITDISAGGCGLIFPTREGRALTANKIYSITFSAMESHMQLSCAVRKIKTDRDRQDVGIEFINISPEDQQKIKLFLEVCNSVVTSRTDFILDKMKHKEKLFGGSLADVSLIDMLQIFDQLRKDGVIRVASGSHQGSIAVRDGQILGASFDLMKGEDALVELFSLQKGEFHISAGDIPSGNMSSPINFNLMEVSRLIDERSCLQAAIPANDEKLRLIKSPEAEDPEVQTVVSALKSGAASVGEIYEATGLSHIRASLIAARLLKDGVIKAG